MPADTAARQLERELGGVRAELGEVKQERDELEARLLTALEELGELRGRLAALEPQDPDLDVRSDDQPERPGASSAPPPPLPLDSMRAPKPEVYTVSGIPPPESLAPSGRGASGPPASPSVLPVLPVLPTPSRSSASGEMSRVVVSTHPPAHVGGVDGSPPSSRNRRTMERRPCEFDVEFLGDTHFTSGLTQDISEGGVFVATYQSLTIGTAVSLAFDLPSGHRVEARGEVRWVRGEREDADSRPGLGIAFTELGPEALARIVEYCGSTPAHYYEF